MSRVRVKMCGITSSKDLLASVNAGADAVGFVVDVPQSPRTLSMGEAEKLIKGTPVFVETVVVTVPKDISHLERVYKKLEPRIIQVHGLSHLYKDVRKRLRGVRLICAIQAKADKAVNIAVKAAETCDAVLLDTYVSGRHGGTGKVHDWKLSRRVREAIHPKPLILAGGLTPKNVKDAIRVVKPYAVDVSSGVESSPGTKDPDKVFEFIRNAKEVEI